MAKFCTNCGQQLEETNNFCINCGKKIKNKENIELKENSKANKSKTIAGLLAICIGIFGVHNFYLGYTKKAVAQLLITILSFGTLSQISTIWGIVEGIMIFTGRINKDSDGNSLTD